MSFWEQRQSSFSGHFHCSQTALFAWEIGADKMSNLSLVHLPFMVLCMNVGFANSVFGKDTILIFY